MPGRKTKCVHCGDYIFVRTNPESGEKILIRENQIPEIDEAWAIHNGTHDVYLKNINKAKRRQAHVDMTAQCSYVVPEADINWGFLNSELQFHAGNSDWESYRDTKYEMGLQLQGEGKWKGALFHYLGVIYRDLGGPDNLADSFVYDRIEEIMVAGNLDTRDIRKVWDRYIVTTIASALPHDEALAEILWVLEMHMKPIKARL